MEISIEQTKNGKKYKVYNGTYYHIETPEKIILALDNARRLNTRLTLDYGDIETGKSWGEIHDINGYIGRSTGKIKIPILIHNTRSMGGGAILDHCIVAIHTSKGKKEIYKHKNHHTQNN